MKTSTLSETEFKQVQRLAVENEPWSDSLGNLLGLLKVYNKGRIETYSINDRVVAYVETWRIAKHQIQDILNNSYSVFSQPFDNGPVLWIANISVDKTYRGRKDIVAYLKRRVFLKNQDAEFVGGEYNGTRKRKKRYTLLPMKGRVI